MLFILLSILFSCNIVIAQDQEVPTIAKKIMRQNLEAFPYEELDWSSDRYYDFLLFVIKMQLDLKEIPKRTAVFSLLDQHIKRNAIAESTIFADPVSWKDLTLEPISKLEKSL